MSPFAATLTLMNVIGENIKRLREQQGLSIRKLAARIGMSHNTLACYEREAIMPSLDTGYRLAEYFDVPLEYLVKGEKVNSDFCDPNLLSLFREVDEMPLKDRDIVKEFLSRFVKNKRERLGLEKEAKQI